MPIVRFLAPSAFVLLAFLVGCKDKPTLVKVTGKVVDAKGVALTAGSIYFHPAPGNPYAGQQPSCQLGEDGSFTMRTFPYGEGIPPGTWKVTLSPDLASRIRKPDYADPAKTAWTVEVPAEGLRDVVLEAK